MGSLVVSLTHDWNLALIYLGIAGPMTGFVCRNPHKPRSHFNYQSCALLCLGIHTQPHHTAFTLHIHTLQCKFLVLSLNISPCSFFPCSLTSAAPLPLILLHEFISIQGSKNTPWFVHKVFFLHFKLLYNNWFPDFFHFLFSLKSAMI